MIDRYQVLTEIYRENLKEFKDYQKESLDFFTQFLEAFVEYFSLSKGKLILLSWDENTPAEKDLSKAMQLQDDSFWHVRMGIKLIINDEKLPEQNLLFEMSFKRYKGAFIMKLDNSQPIEIPSADGKWHHHEFLKHTYEFLADFYQNDLNKFLDKPESNPLGFDYGLKR